MYRYLLLFAAAIAISLPALAQTEEVISVSAQAMVEVPADRLHFNITIEIEEATPQKAYARHREREGQLVDLLKKHEIAKEHIRFQPVTIRRYRPGRNESPRVRTRQRVRLVLKDFGLYEQIQMTLIDGGFDEFSGNFTSTNMEEGRKKAIRKAVQKAKANASLIADEAGVELRDIKRIQYNTPSIVRSGRTVELAGVASDSPGSLIDNFDQTVPVRAAVTIEFFIRN